MTKESIKLAAEQSWERYEYTDTSGRLYQSVYKDAFQEGVRWLIGRMMQMPIDILLNQILKIHEELNTKSK